MDTWLTLEQLKCLEAQLDYGNLYDYIVSCIEDYHEINVEGDVEVTILDYELAEVERACEDIPQLYALQAQVRAEMAE